MLNSKTLTKLLIAMLVCAGLVILIIYKTNSSAIKNNNALFLPNLVDNAGQVSRLIIQDRDHTLTFERVNNIWQIAERNNFPVLHDKVEEVLFGLGDMRIVEPKTVNPQLYSQLDVNDITEENSRALLITVQDAQQKDLAKLLIGKREGWRNGEEYLERIFVRKFGDQQTWLVQGLVPISNDIKDWVDQPLLSIVDEQKIKQVKITRADGEKILIAKQGSDQEDFMLETSKPKIGMVLDIDAINTVPFEIAELEFKDVISASNEQIDWSKGVLAELETFSGIIVELNIIQHNDATIGKIQAYTAVDSSPELQLQVADFNAQKQGWYYKLSNEFYKTISMGNMDFLKVADVADVSEGAPG